MKYLFIVVFLILMGQCVAQKILYHSLEITYIGLNAFDLITTNKILHADGTERNPFMASLVEHPIEMVAFKTLCVATFLGSCRIIHKEHPKGALAILIGGNLLYGAIVTHNYQIYLRLRL